MELKQLKEAVFQLQQDRDCLCKMIETNADSIKNLCKTITFLQIISVIQTLLIFMIMGR